MSKVHRIGICITATLLVALGLTIVWAKGRPASPARTSTDSVRVVQLRLTFEDGHWANVTEVDGGTIKVEKDGKKLEISPYIRDHGKVELRVSQAVQRDGKETLEALDTLMVDKGLMKVNRASLPLNVQVLDTEKTLSAAVLATRTATCCVRTCNGTLVCGVCVCTDCGRCGPGWCDCAMPGPTDRQ